MPRPRAPRDPPRSEDAIPQHPGAARRCVHLSRAWLMAELLAAMSRRHVTPPCGGASAGKSGRALALCSRLLCQFVDGHWCGVRDRKWLRPTYACRGIRSSVMLRVAVREQDAAPFATMCDTLHRVLCGVCSNACVPT